MFVFTITVPRSVVLLLVVLQCMDFFKKTGMSVPDYLSLLNSPKSPSYSLFQQLWGFESPSGGLFSSCLFYIRRLCPPVAFSC